MRTITYKSPTDRGFHQLFSEVSDAEQQRLAQAVDGGEFKRRDGHGDLTRGLSWEIHAISPGKATKPWEFHQEKWNPSWEFTKHRGMQRGFRADRISLRFHGES